MVLHISVRRVQAEEVWHWGCCLPGVRCGAACHALVLSLQAVTAMSTRGGATLTWPCSWPRGTPVGLCVMAASTTPWAAAATSASPSTTGTFAPTSGPPLPAPVSVLGPQPHSLSQPYGSWCHLPQPHSSWCQQPELLMILSLGSVRL